MTVITLSLSGRHSEIGSRARARRWPPLSRAALGCCMVLALIGSRLAWQLSSSASRQEIASPRAVTGANDSADEQNFQTEVDLDENEVTDALATYGIDPSGSVYELHSPRTEPLRAAPPKS
jgi:hypothetical protein